jgi:hypothetical protein
MNTNQIDYKKLVYSYNGETKYYQLSEKPLSFDKLPNDLKVEQTRRPDIIKSKFIIRGRIKNKKYTFFTGLLETKYKNLFFGDYFQRINGVKKNSFILFLFSEDKQKIEIYFFNNFKLYPKRRSNFISEFVLKIKRERLPDPLLCSNQINK